MKSLGPADDDDAARADTPRSWLRPTTLADAAVLAEVHAEAFAKPWSQAQIASTLMGYGAAGLVAGRGGQAQAMILMRVAVDEAEVLTLAVCLAQRRRGLGQVVIQAAAHLAKTLGAATLWLEVAVDNSAAIALYRRTGFVEAGRRPRYYARTDMQAVDALLMRRSLNTGDA